MPVHIPESTETYTSPLTPPPSQCENSFKSSSILSSRKKKWTVTNTSRLWGGMFLHLASFHFSFYCVFSVYFISLSIHLLVEGIKSHDNVNAGFESQGKEARKLLCCTNFIIWQNQRHLWFGFCFLVFLVLFFLPVYLSKI